MASQSLLECINSTLAYSCFPEQRGKWVFHICKNCHFKSHWLEIFGIAIKELSGIFVEVFQILLLFNKETMELWFVAHVVTFVIIHNLQQS